MRGAAEAIRQRDAVNSVTLLKVPRKNRGIRATFDQDWINHLVGPTHFTTRGTHWEARRRDQEAEGVDVGGEWGGVSPFPATRRSGDRAL